MNSFLKTIVRFVIFGTLGYAALNGLHYYKRCTNLPINYPLIGSYGFRHLAQHFFDQPKKIWINLFGKSINPLDVKEGDIVFIKNDPYYLNQFFKNVHPYIKHNYILLSHNGDETIPGVWEKHLDDPHLMAWCGCNVGPTTHPKMHPIPLGVLGGLNKHLPTDAHEAWGRVLLDITSKKITKTNMVYLNLNVTTNISERGKALTYFKNKPFCTNTRGRPYEHYLREMATFKFVVSPHGRGLDCYRTWEALMLGCIPIVKKSCLDPLYEGLPVLIVDNWEDVTEAYLEQAYQKMSRTTYNMERLSIDYWILKIIKLKQKTT